MTTCAICGFTSEMAFRFCPECGTEQIPSTGAEQRRVVTVLFCDLTGSTSLGESIDAERLRAVLGRYSDRMRAVVERHGGTVEKFVGDAVMAAFGIPVAHEDDALRALRAAVQMREAVAELNLEVRIGVTTGEVVRGTDGRLVTGDPVNVAARLQQAARPGDILIGDPTIGLVRGAVETEPIEPLALKGKADRVAAARLVSLSDDPAPRPMPTFVGREHELASIRDSWDRVRREAACELVTIVGEAGVGKSRLVVEALIGIDAAVARGRCLPYGEGATYAPIVDVLRQLVVIPPESAAPAIRSLLGKGDTRSSPEDIAWAVRKTLERAASERPLVLVIDDLQWAEEALRDLVEHVALLSAEAPILMLCLARTDLVERRPTWPVTIRLEPLSETDVDRLLAGRTDPGLRAGIVRAAGGNPLFVEEMLAMAASGEVAVPPTLHALLAARLDQLDTAERDLLGRASIEGEVFHRGALHALGAAGDPVTPLLAALVRKELIRPDRPRYPDEDGFRFRHVLIRDVAYEAVPKAIRADLHAGVARWLANRPEDVDELVGFHLEQACRYREELALELDGQLADEASRRLRSAGRRAQLLADHTAAATLFERALALAPAGGVDVAAELELIEALSWTGEEARLAERVAATSERAAAAGDDLGAECLRLRGALVDVDTAQEGAVGRVEAAADDARTRFARAGYELGLYVAAQAIGQIAFERARTDAARDAYDQAAEHATRAGLSGDFLEWRAAARHYGTSTPNDVLAWLDHHVPQPGLDPWVLAYRALSLAMLGRAEEGGAILDAAVEALRDRGGGVRLGVLLGIEAVDLRLLAGDPDGGVASGEEGCAMLTDLGAHGFLSTACGTLARAYLTRGDLDGAARNAERSAEVGGSEDAFTQFLWRGVLAQVQARHRSGDGGETLAREAVAIVGATDYLNGQAEADTDLGEVLFAAGRVDEARASFERAVERFTRKGNAVMAERVRQRAHLSSS